MRRRSSTAVLMLVGSVLVLDTGLRAESSTPLSVRSRTVELHYRANPADAEIELWCTRDRGITWQCWGKDDDHASPLVFTAPGEGLFGFTMIAYVGGKPSRPTPTAYEPPQRWVFIDATPPLAQWSTVEPAEGFATNRTLQLRWTAHDDNLSGRPIALSYQSSTDQAWHEIDSAVANTGMYDWKLPETVAGQVMVKLIVRDEGGNSVERVFGPVAMEKYLRSPSTMPVVEQNAKPQPTSRPDSLAMGLPAATQPAPLPRVDLLKQRMAMDLYRQATWHLQRGQYAVAAERLRESLEQDPDLLEARHDLAGILYRQQDYDRAIDEYRAVLARNPKYESALYGSALAYVAKRDYDSSRDMLTRLLSVNDHNADAWLDLGDVLFMMGDVTNARGHWQRAMKIDPSAKELVTKAQRRLDQYGANQVSVAK
jgi:Tfp pilus assembly protein PilF